MYSNGYAIEFHDRQIQHYLPELVRSEREIQIICDEINKLLSKGDMKVVKIYLMNSALPQ